MNKINWSDVVNNTIDFCKCYWSFVLIAIAIQIFSFWLYSGCK